MRRVHVEPDEALRQAHTSDSLISTAARSPPAAASQASSRATCAGAALPR